MALVEQEPTTLCSDTLECVIPLEYSHGILRVTSDPGREETPVIMSTGIKRAMACATTAVALAGGVAVAPGAAYANGGAPYNGKCGSGFTVIDHGDIIYGTVYLTYNKATGENCVITIRANPGSRIQMEAYIHTAGGRSKNETGSYTSWVSTDGVYAAHECVSWGGSVWPEGLDVPGGRPADYRFDQPNSHCG